jgi:hypothetical protein
MAPAVSALGCQCLQIQVSDKVMHALEDTLQKVTRQGRRCPSASFRVGETALLVHAQDDRHRAVPTVRLGLPPLPKVSSTGAVSRHGSLSDTEASWSAVGSVHLPRNSQTLVPGRTR